MKCTNKHLSLCAPWSQSTRINIKLFIKLDANLISLHSLRKRVRLTVCNLGSWLTQPRSGKYEFCSRTFTEYMLTAMPTLETKKHSFENTEETRTDYKKHKCQNSRIVGRAQEIRFTENILALSQKSRQK